MSPINIPTITPGQTLIVEIDIAEHYATIWIDAYTGVILYQLINKDEPIAMGSALSVETALSYLPSVLSVSL